MSFKFTRLTIPDVILIESQIFQDERGFFSENFKESVFEDYGINKNFVQDNFSYSLKGVLRGLHFQNPPKAQAKLVTVLKGEIFDVAVDLRVNSPTYGKWIAEILSEYLEAFWYFWFITWLCKNYAFNIIFIKMQL